MPKQRSSVAHGDHEEDFVLDILYADLNRISTFLSQFSDFGHLTSISSGRRAERKKDDRTTLQATGSAVIAKAKGDFSTGYSAGHEEKNEKVFDPKWVNTLSFLDEIDSKGLLNRDIYSAHLGDLVWLEGRVRIRDLTLMGKIWELPTIKAFVKSGEAPLSRQQRRAKRGTGNSTDQPNETDLVFDLLKVLPHSLQAIIGTDPQSWVVLDEDFLVVQRSDFLLKYGGNIPGSWNVVGILDAYPDRVPLREDFTSAPAIDQISDVMLSHIEPIARQFLGRPERAYGLTPLVIYRLVGRSRSP